MINKKTINLVLIFLLSFAFKVSAQVSVPASLQAALFYKIFSFNKSLTKKNKKQLDMTILVSPSNEVSNKSARRLYDAFSKLSTRKIGNKTIKLRDPISYKEMASSYDIVYVTSGHDRIIRDIISKCNQWKVMCITSEEEYIRQGMAVGVGIRENKPKILLNRKGTKASGVQLSSKIMTLAEFF